MLKISIKGKDMSSCLLDASRTLSALPPDSLLMFLGARGKNSSNMSCAGSERASAWPCQSPKQDGRRLELRLLSGRQVYSWLFSNLQHQRTSPKSIRSLIYHRVAILNFSVCGGLCVSVFGRFLSFFKQCVLSAYWGPMQRSSSPFLWGGSSPTS